MVEQLMVGRLCDFVCSRDSERALDAQAHLGEKAMTHPAVPDLGHGIDLINLESARSGAMIWLGSPFTSRPGSDRWRVRGRYLFLER